VSPASEIPLRIEENTVKWSEAKVAVTVCSEESRGDEAERAVAERAPTSGRMEETEMEATNDACQTAVWLTIQLRTRCIHPSYWMRQE
jgi:hypothetical protein